MKNELEKAENLLFPDKNNIEKAHNEGDIHPNGKLVWRKTPSGYDWRHIKKTDSKQSESKQAEPKKSSTKFKKYGTDPEMDKKVNDFNSEVRTDMAKQGYGIDKLVNDKNTDVRTAVARRRYGLDKLIDDEDWHVRLEVAKQGYRLDKLINDNNSFVRIEVARQGYGLDKLINDKDSFVRLEVARRRYGLDKLIDDEDTDVRAVVAQQGYGLDKLINDKDWYVRQKVAEQGYGLDKLINDKDLMVRELAMEKLKYKNKTIQQEEKEHSNTYKELQQDAKNGKIDMSKKEFAEKINEDHKRSEHEDFLSQNEESYIEKENYPKKVLEEMNKRDSTFFVGKKGNVYKIYSQNNKLIQNIAVKKDNMNIQKAENLLFPDKKKISVKKRKKESELEKAENLLFPDKNNIEKAHNEGDIHPNGKLVWRKTPSGYDWRHIKKTENKAEPQKAEHKNVDNKIIIKVEIKEDKSKNLKRFFVNDIEVASYRKKRDWFCTIKNGHPSNIRDKVKDCHESNWDIDALRKILGDKMPKKYRDSEFYKTEASADTTWGYTGYKLTSKKVKELLEMYLND